MADNFDFSAFDFNNNQSKNFDSFWERESVKNDNNSFFSDDSKKGKKESKPESKEASRQASKENMKFSSKKQSMVNEISLGQFGDPQQPSQMKSSGISKRFNVEKQSEEEVMQPAGNMSRTLSDIDVSEFDKNNSGYFFASQTPRNNRTSKDQNYQALKKYLSQPKKVNFDQFFCQLDQKQVANSSFLKREQYSTQQQFQEYKRRIKDQKRNEQLMRQHENKYKAPTRQQRKPSIQISVPKVIEINFFKKKQNVQSSNNNNILDEDLVQFNEDQKIEQAQSSPKSNGFITFNSKNDPIKSKNNFQPDQDFFNEQNQKQEEKSEKSSKNKESVITKSKLPMIIDADQNIFQTTEEEIKLNNLFGNFKKMMENYNLLRGELKSNTQEHQKLMKQISHLKHDYSQKQSEQQKNSSNQFSQSSQGTPRQSRIQEKDKINQIEMDIFKKIQNLENVVKETFDKDNDEKNNLVWINPDFIAGSEKLISPSPTPNQLSKSNNDRFGELTKNQQQSPSNHSYLEQIMSPLDMRLNVNTEQFNINSRVSHSKSVAFSPPPKKLYEGQCHEPRHLSVDLNYKNTCIQDSSSVIFQSFDFLISAKYTFIRTGRKHVKISIKIKNKTILSLADFMVIMYGSIGQILQINPPKMYVEKFGPEQSKNLEAIVDSFKIGGEPIRMQISYRTERERKGKISVSIPRPIVKFMDIKFTHEAQFNQIWNSTKNELYLMPRNLNFQLIKSTEDIKLIFPFIEISQNDEQQFSYGLIFSILNVEGSLLLKLTCNIQGTASVHLKYQPLNLRGYAKQVLDTLNLIIFS